MSIKNRLIKTALKLISIPKHPQTKERRILAVATTALGDTLWATPALESLRASFPNAHIAALTSPIGLEVLQNNPWTNQLYLLSKSLWKTLYQDRFDTILLFHASQRFVLPLCTLLGATQIVGTAGLNKGLDSLLTHPLPNDYQHEIVRRLKMVEAIGGHITSETLSFFPDRTPKRTLANAKWIAIHPGSKDGFKRWPVDHFATVARRLQERTPCNILITGTELPLMQALAAKIPGAHLADPHLTLRAFANLLSQIDLLISNDTGPVHLACALHRPVVALYSSTDPHLCGPHKAPLATALYKRRTCEPCLKRQCRRPFCLLQIGVSDVVDAAMSHLD